MTISSVYGSATPDPIWQTPVGTTGTAATPATASPSSQANSTASPFQSLAADLQSWLTSLQASGTMGAGATPGTPTSQGPTNTGDPDDTAAAAGAAQNGTRVHRHHHHHGGGEAGTAASDGQGGTGAAGSTVGAGGSSAATGSGLAPQTGGQLANSLAADVMRAMQAYGGAGGSPSGALATST